MKAMKKAGALLLGAAMTLTMFAGCSKSLPVITVAALEDMKELKIGVQSGTTGDTLATKEVSSNPTTNVMGYKSGMDAALALKAGNIDCIILDELPAKSIVGQNSDLQIIDLNLEPEEYAIAVKKGNTALLDSINATIARMKGDGTYENLTAAFMPADGVIKIPESGTMEGDVIKMATNAEFPPFEYLDGTNVVGFDVSMSQEIAKDMGKKLEVVNQAFDSLLMALDSGTVDFVAAGMSVTPERLEEVDFSEPYYSSKQVIIVRK